MGERRIYWRRRGFLRLMSRLRIPPPSAAALLAVLGLLAGSLAAEAATQDGYTTSCGVELMPGLTTTPGGPLCGTDGRDTVSFAADPAPRVFFGESGRDTVEGSPFDDTLRGGPGNDAINGGAGNDSIDAGDDSDVVYGGEGDDRIVERRFGIRERFFGGPGGDTIAGGRGTDEIHGEDGADVLLGGSGSDVLDGGDGNDRLFGGPNRDRFECGPGEDTVYRVRSSSDRSSAGRADGSVQGKNCETIVDIDPTAAFALKDRIGGAGPDTLTGGSGRDLLQGKGGSDRLYGGGGDDELEGDGASRQGDDLLMGGSGKDRLAGRSGDDKLYGDASSPNAGPAGSDELVGGSGRDLLVGGPGNDLLLAAYDGDRVLAGTGNDVVSLLGGSSRGRSNVDCGPGRDIVIVKAEKPRTYRNCESFAEQFHEADFGFLYRPSPETYP